MGNESQRLPAYIYLNGTLHAPDDLVVPARFLFWQSVQFGDSLFEGLRFGKHGVLHLTEHRERLYESSLVVGMKLPDRVEFDRAIRSIIDRCGFQEGYVRLFAARRETGWGVSTSDLFEATLYGFVGNISLHEHPDIAIMISHFRRPEFSSVPTRIKWSGCYVNSKLAARDAQLHGFDDAVMLTSKGHVSESTVANIFWFDDNRLWTPVSDEVTNCVPGICRKHVIRIAREMGLVVEEGYFDATSLISCQEAFLTGTGAGIVPIRQIGENMKSSPGEVTSEIKREFLSQLQKMSEPL